MAREPLSRTHPEIATEANGWDPDKITPGSDRKLQWICSHGHTWLAAVSARTRGSGCPYCAGTRPIVGVNDLATTHPSLASEAHGWDPQTAKSGSNRKLRWRCQRGHSWHAVVANRARNGAGCPICSNQKVLSGFNDLATTHPTLASEADSWDPTTVIAGTNKILRWRCREGHKFAMRGNSRSSQGLGCPFCSGQRVLQGFNDLATTHPEVASEMVNGDPRSVSKGSDKKFQWRCTSGHVWVATVGSRTLGNGCPFCSGQRPVVGVNDLLTTHPKLAMEVDGWDPTEAMRGSSQSKAWKCALGHSWKARVADRAIHGQGCPVCGGKRALAGFNDLSTTHPKIAAQAHGWDPRTVTHGSQSRKKWICDLGHVWTAQVVNRCNLHHGCAVCAGKQIIVGVNDLATVLPSLAAEAHDWDPRTVTRASGRKVKWKCSEGHIWTAPINNRAFGRGCPSCTKFGFDPNEDGWLYLLEHDKLEMLQIGITNNPNQRLRKHELRGWVAIDIRGPMDGHVTQRLETACLQALEARGALLGHKADIERFDGYSEAWFKHSLPVTNLKQIVAWQYEVDNLL